MEKILRAGEDGIFVGRRELRDIAVKCLFQYDFICGRNAGETGDAVCNAANFDRKGMVERLIESISDEGMSESGESAADITAEGEYESYFEQVVSGTIDHLEKIDALIAEYSHEWTFDRISRIDRAVLRVAVYELMERQDVPAVVAINEAIEISKKYSGEKSGTYVNGVLGGIYASLQD